MKKTTYTVKDKEVKANELTLDDCDWLFSKFVSENGFYPEGKICDISHNLPHWRILKKILDSHDILLSDWQRQHGKTNHVRCHPKDYDIYLSRYKEYCNSMGRAFLSEELRDNSLALPQAKYFVKYCPNPNVKTYDDFVEWCGFKRNSLWKNKDDVVKELIEKEKELGRPITSKDLRDGALSFSPIVINRIWGSLKRCREEVGLKKYIVQPHHSFSEYCSMLDNCLETIYANTGRKIISWRDIEGEMSGEYSLDHHTILRAFRRENSDFYQYVLSKGFEFTPYSCGIIYYTDDGELCRSIQELDYTNFLNNELGLKYKLNYQRDVMYKTFVDCKSKINCDYVIEYENQKYYIEIAGMLYTDNDLFKKYDTQRKENYRLKTIQKLDILQKSGVKYLFIYQKDIRDGSFKQKTIELLKGDDLNARTQQTYSSS